jgi:hypothetical protein
MKVYDAESRTKAIYANRSLNINNNETGHRNRRHYPDLALDPNFSKALIPSRKAKTELIDNSPVAILVLDPGHHVQNVQPGV